MAKDVLNSLVKSTMQDAFPAPAELVALTQTKYGTPAPAHEMQAAK